MEQEEKNMVIISMDIIINNPHSNVSIPYYPTFNTTMEFAGYEKEIKNTDPEVKVKIKGKKIKVK